MVRTAMGSTRETASSVDLIKAGIVDPVKVCYSAVRNAASVAGLILTTQTLIAKKPDDYDPTAGRPWAAAPSYCEPKAFSSEVDTGSREENAAKQKLGARF